MEELSQLVDTAGGEVAAVVLQQRQTPDPRSFLGEGKVAELKEIVSNSACDLAVFDNELSPSQLRVLSEELGVKVLDRSGLILDIFAQRARTREGQLQVELAQYEYLLPRLTGMWSHLVRQTASGGASPIGTRGPARPSSKPTAATSGARSKSSARSWNRCVRSAASSAAGVSATPCPSSPSSATPTPANPRC